MVTLEVSDWRHCTETDLLRHARSGDKEAIMELIRRSEPTVRWVIRRRLDPRCLRVVGIDDLLQELRVDFLSRAINPVAFATLQGFFSYLLRSGCHKAQEINRRWIGAGKRSLARDSNENAYDCTEPPAAAASGAELEEELIEAYFHLPDPVSHVYFLRMQGGTPGEIAEILGISLAAAYRALVIAEECLQTRLR